MAAAMVVSVVRLGKTMAAGPCINRGVTREPAIDGAALFRRVSLRPWSRSGRARDFAGRRGSELMEVRVYRGRPNLERQPGTPGANNRQTVMWQSSDRVTVIRRNLKYPPDNPAARAMEKGINAAVAADMIRLGMSCYMNVAIQFSSDNDLIPEIKVLAEMPQCHVEVASWSGAHRICFPGTQQPWCHHRTEADFQAVRDPYDYTDHL